MKKITVSALIFISLLLSIVAVLPRTYSIYSPVADDSQNVKDLIHSKLTSVKDNYHVKKQTILIPQAYGSHEYEDARAYGAVNFDTGEILTQKNLSEPLPIASVTKIMTAVVALDLADRNELFTVTEKAANVVPTKIGVVKGQKMSLEELLNAMLLTSANDAAEVIRDGIDAKYGGEVFIDAMNMKAEHLGLSNSHFQNPQGFDSKDNYSSVEDLMVLSHYALSHYPLIEEIVKKDFEYLPENNNHKQFHLYNWNGLIDVYPNTYGVKIGNTDRAGKTTVVVSEREGKKVLAVVLGAPGVLERDLWSSQLLDLGFQKIADLKPVNVTEEMLREKYSTWVY